ncbi:MAG: EthD family reductase [Actinomycetota bacterium]
MLSMAVYYRAPDDAEAFERRYIDGHLPLVKKYENMKSCEFNKVTRQLQGDFPYAYVFVGFWENKDGWKADLSSDQAKIATEDAKSFAPPFDVVVCDTIA